MVYLHALRTNVLESTDEWFDDHPGRGLKALASLASKHYDQLDKDPKTGTAGLWCTTPSNSTSRERETTTISSASGSRTTRSPGRWLLPKCSCCCMGGMGRSGWRTSGGSSAAMRSEYVICHCWTCSALNLLVDGLTALCESSVGIEHLERSPNRTATRWPNMRTLSSFIRILPSLSLQPSA